MNILSLSLSTLLMEFWWLYIFQAREARKKVLQEMSEETKAAFEKMRFYKFYPVQTQDSPDISNVKVTQHILTLFWMVQSRKEIWNNLQYS